MTMHLLRISFETLGIGDEPLSSAKPNAWRLYARCATVKPETCTLFEQIGVLKSRVDQRAAMNTLRKLVKVAATGSPLTVHYDEKQCHEIHSFNYLGKERKIWRIRNGSVRLAFYYGQGKLIFLAGILAKRRDSLSRAEKTALERETCLYIDAEQQQQLLLVEE